MKRKTGIIIVLVAVLLACSHILLIAIPREAIAVQRSALTTSPADVGLAYDAFEISPQDSNLILQGWWIPATPSRASLVFVHGGGSNRHSRYFGSLKFYRAMVDQGISVAAIDLRNHGESGSDENGLQFGRTEKYDALAVINWTRQKTPHAPLFAMGISMGGATLIQAAAAGAQLDGLILLDSLLDTRDTFKQGAWVQTGMAPALFTVSAWAATAFFGLPHGDEQALEQAIALKLPILAIQDPDDPVTRARYSSELAQRNTQVTLWTAPPINPGHPDLAWKDRWGSHVSAFLFYPQETAAQIMQFLDPIIAAHSGEQTPLNLVEETAANWDSEPQQ